MAVNMLLHVRIKLYVQYKIICYLRDFILLFRVIIIKVPQQFQFMLSALSTMTRT